MDELILSDTEEEQLSLLGDIVEGDGSVSMIEVDDLAMDHEGKKGRGRPKGSKNKRVDEWADYALGMFPSPIIKWGRIASMDTKQLAKYLSDDKHTCSMLEAYDRQHQAAIKFAEYVHQKQPMAIAVKSEQLISLQLAVGQGYAAFADSVGVQVTEVEVIEITAEDEEENAEQNQ